MKLLAVVLLLVAACSAEVTQEQATKYLERFGYYNPYVFGSAVEDSLKQFQEFAGLAVTGKLDDATIKQMEKPRCGRPDHDAPLTYRDSKWRKTHLTYRFLKYTRDLSQSVQREAIVRGMNLWTTVTPLSFSEARGSSSDITIGFYERGHGDNSAFDGPGRVLAHAYFPENGRLHYDDAEKWTTRSKSGTNLDWVTTHEFGHSLGLEHSQVKGSIMYPYYQGYIPNMKLHSDDIRRIQAQYGSKSSGGGNSNCSDKNVSCPKWKYLCGKHDYVKAYCKKTCGTC